MLVRNIEIFLKKKKRSINMVVSDLKIFLQNRKQLLVEYISNYSKM